MKELSKTRGLKGMVEIADDTIVISSDEPSFKKLQNIIDVVKDSQDPGDRRHPPRDHAEGEARTSTSSTPRAPTSRRSWRRTGVDKKRTTTNAIQEILRGARASRRRATPIIDEASRTLDEQGLNVDIRHIMLVADLMTNDGDVKAIGRHGISGRKSSVLARAAFEITAAHLLHAALTGEEDHLDGVAENIIVGQPVTLGTGAVNLVYAPVSRGQ